MVTHTHALAYEGARFYLLAQAAWPDPADQWTHKGRLLWARQLLVAPLLERLASGQTCPSLLSAALGSIKHVQRVIDYQT